MDCMRVELPFHACTSGTVHRAGVAMGQACICPLGHLAVDMPVGYQARRMTSMAAITLSQWATALGGIMYVYLGLRACSAQV